MEQASLVAMYYGNGFIHGKARPAYWVTIAAHDGYDGCDGTRDIEPRHSQAADAVYAGR